RPFQVRDQAGGLVEGVVRQGEAQGLAFGVQRRWRQVVQGQDANGGAGGGQRAGPFLDLAIGQQLLLAGVQVLNRSRARGGGADLGGLGLDAGGVLGQFIPLAGQEGGEAQRGEHRPAADDQGQ